MWVKLDVLGINVPCFDGCKQNSTFSGCAHRVSTGVSKFDVRGMNAVIFDSCEPYSMFLACMGRVSTSVGQIRRS